MIKTTMTMAVKPILKMMVKAIMTMMIKKFVIMMVRSIFKVKNKINCVLFHRKMINSGMFLINLKFCYKKVHHLNIIKQCYRLELWRLLVLLVK